MARKSLKGGAYEREVCRQLSLWYSHGKHDDWFWRSSQSGGRATTRAKTGRRTIGHCSDVAATCSEGEALVRVMSPEIKRGYNRSAHMADLLEYTEKQWKNPPPGSMADFIKQAAAAAERGGSRYWTLIHRRDKHPAMIYMPHRLFVKFLGDLDSADFGTKRTIHIQPNADFCETILAMLLSDFLEEANPTVVRKLYREGLGNVRLRNRR